MACGEGVGLAGKAPYRSGSHGIGREYCEQDFRALISHSVLLRSHASVGPAITPWGSLATMLALARRDGEEVCTGELVKLELWQCRLPESSCARYLEHSSNMKRL